MKRVLSVAGIVLTAAGCTSYGSLASAVSFSAAVYDPRIVGTWEARDSSGATRVEVSRSNPAEYTVHLTDSRGADARMTATLGPLSGDVWVMDLVPAQPQIDTIRRLGGLEQHLQVFVTISDSIIRVTTIQPDSLVKHLRDGRRPRMAYFIQHNGDLVLTDSTPLLHRGLRDYFQSTHRQFEWTVFRRIGRRAASN